MVSGATMNLLHDRRSRFAAVLITAAALAAILIAASRLSTGDAGDSQPVDSQPSSAASVAPEDPSQPALLAGIEQQGTALGSPAAPVTLVEYADLQCPYCAEWARQALPTLVTDYVRTGRLRIVFTGLAFIGPDSETALRTALAAGRDNHLWDVVHGLYEDQGAENSSWVTDELVREIAAGVPGLDAERLFENRSEKRIGGELERAAASARAAGITGTPAFQIGPTAGRLQLLEVTSLGPEGMVPAIEALLAR